MAWFKCFPWMFNLQQNHFPAYNNKIKSLFVWSIYNPNKRNSRKDRVGHNRNSGIRAFPSREVSLLCQGGAIIFLRKEIMFYTVIINSSSRSYFSPDVFFGPKYVGYVRKVAVSWHITDKTGGNNKAWVHFRSRWGEEELRRIAITRAHAEAQLLLDTALMIFLMLSPPPH